MPFIWLLSSQSRFISHSQCRVSGNFKKNRYLVLQKKNRNRNLYTDNTVKLRLKFFKQNQSILSSCEPCVKLQLQSNGGISEIMNVKLIYCSHLRKKNSSLFGSLYNNRNRNRNL